MRPTATEQTDIEKVKERLVWERPVLARMRAADAEQHIFHGGSDDGHNQMS
jgi:hypothetical protein